MKKEGILCWRGEKKLDSDLRPNKSAGWIDEDVRERRRKRRKFRERAGQREGEGGPRQWKCCGGEK